MKKFYHSTTFDFSPQAKQWVLDKYRAKFEKETFGHNTDLTQYTEPAQEEWLASSVGQELTAYLATYGCDTKFFGINAILCNLGDPDPHIDTKIDVTDGTVHQIKSRFNVLVLGKSSDTLTWWGDFEYGDSRVVDTQFLAPNGHYYTNKSVPGKSKQERWDYLGTPSLIAGNVYTPSAFIKTDCAHTVSCTPGPRLIVVVSLDKSIEEILDSTRVS